MKKILTILVIILMGCGMNGLAQGKLTRPTTEQQTQTSKPKKNVPKVSVSEPDGYINGYGYVDLGLSSGLKWATCNIGAYSTSDYGNYYAWGETRTNSSYTIDNSITINRSGHELRSSGIIDSSMSRLTMSYDAANANWGESWRMPTAKEFHELKDTCTWVWASHGGHNGYKVTGPNGHSIFIPAAGCREDDRLSNQGKKGYYWSSSRGFDIDTQASIDLNFTSSTIQLCAQFRALGFSVRPVSE